QIHYDTGVEKQLTFGAVATALVREGAVYFRYAGQAGLWRWHPDSDGLALLNSDLEDNSRLLALTAEGVYYVIGDECAEGGIFYRSLGGGERRTQLPADGEPRVTTDYRPGRGALYSPCRLPEADILRWQ